MPKIKPNTAKRKMAITRRPILMVIIILAIAIIGLILAKILTNTTSEDSGDQLDDTTSEVATQSETLGVNEDSDEVVSNKTPKQYEGENANNYTDLTGAITYAEVSGTDLIIRTSIDQELSTSSTCILTATSGNNSITEQSGIINNPSSSSCEGFTIPISRLGSGTWQLKIKVTGNNKSGIITGEVTI